MPGFTSAIGLNVAPIERRFYQKPHKWKAADYKVRDTQIHVLHHLHICLDFCTPRNSQ